MKALSTARGRRRREDAEAVENVKAQAEQWVAQVRQGFLEARSKLDAEVQSVRTSLTEAEGALKTERERRAELERALESERRQRAELQRRLDEEAERRSRSRREQTPAPARRMDRAQRWAAARRLAAEGLSQREIARRLGINRRTVARLVKADEPPRYRRAPQGSILDPLEPVMRSVIRDRPRITATEMTELLRSHGYRGSVDLVRRRLRDLRTSR